MKAKKIVSLLLASAMVLPCVLTAAACRKKTDDTETGVRGETAYGNKTLTDAVKDPVQEVQIKLIRGKNVIASGSDSLSYSGSLTAGDVIEISSDYRYLNVNLFEDIGEQLVYSPTGRFTFQVPSAASQAIYSANTFKGTTHTFTASVASDSDVAQADRNLAVNPYDYMYVDEKNDQNASSLLAVTDSAAVEGGQVAVYPHAYANRVTRNEVGFYARNAIDGSAESDGHGNYPYQSWGYNQAADAEFVVYFGREVTLNKLAFVLRADYSGTKEHDTYWQDATVEFSDGSTYLAEFTKTGDRQEFDLGKEVSTSSVRIKSMNAVQSTSSENYAALTEFEAYGKEKTDKNSVAEKTSITTTFGGKEGKQFTTDAYSYSEIKGNMDRVNDWFIDITETTNYQIPDYNGVNMQVKVNDNGWKDAVYYSGLTEAFFTTGDMDNYYFLRAVGDSFSYLINSGKYTPHGDWYQIGETYLQLNDLSTAAYKTASVISNADYNIARDPNDTQAPSGLGLDTSRDWSHMGFWWCDALYMAMNTYTLLSRQTGNDKYVEAAYAGYQHWKSVLYNETYGLWHRDSTQFTVYTSKTDENGKVPTFWARGNAWVLAALAKQLMYLDANQYPEMYAEYEADFRELAASILSYQREDGTWNASIVDETYYGGKESTGTCGFIYAFCVGLELGILDGDTYFPAVQKAYDCLINECMIGDQLGYMQTTGYQPQNYKSEEYSRELTHEFGMGLFLLASSGMMRICSDYQAPSIIVPADPQAALLG